MEGASQAEAVGESQPVTRERARDISWRIPHDSSSPTNCGRSGGGRGGGGLEERMIACGDLFDGADPSMIVAAMEAAAAEAMPSGGKGGKGSFGGGGKRSHRRAPSNESGGGENDSQQSNASDVSRHRNRLWSYLFRNVNRAVDELYYACEWENNIAQIQEAAKMMDSCKRDFEKLIERIKVQTEFEAGIGNDSCEEDGTGTAREHSTPPGGRAAGPGRDGGGDSGRGGGQASCDRADFSNSSGGRSSGAIAWEVRKFNPGSASPHKSIVNALERLDSAEKGAVSVGGGDFGDQEKRRRKRGKSGKGKGKGGKKGKGSQRQRDFVGRLKQAAALALATAPEGTAVADAAESDAGPQCRIQRSDSEVCRAAEVSANGGGGDLQQLSPEQNRRENDANAANNNSEGEHPAEAAAGVSNDEKGALVAGNAWSKRPNIVPDSPMALLQQQSRGGATVGAPATLRSVHQATKARSKGSCTRKATKSATAAGSGPGGRGGKRANTDGRPHSRGGISSGSDGASSSSSSTTTTSSGASSARTSPTAPPPQAPETDSPSSFVVDESLAMEEAAARTVSRGDAAGEERRREGEKAKRPAALDIPQDAGCWYQSSSESESGSSDDDADGFDRSSGGFRDGSSYGYGPFALHNKLSSPERRKRSPSETKRIQDERQWVAEENRRNKLEQEQERLRKHQAHVRDVHARQKSKRQADRLQIEQRQAEAESRREAHITSIRQRATSENSKVEEVQFISVMTADADREEVEMRLASVEKRIVAGRERREKFLRQKGGRVAEKIAERERAAEQKKAEFGQLLEEQRVLLQRRMELAGAAREEQQARQKQRHDDKERKASERRQQIADQKRAKAEERAQRAQRAKDRRVSTDSTGEQEAEVVAAAAGDTVEQHNQSNTQARPQFSPARLRAELKQTTGCSAAGDGGDAPSPSSSPAVAQDSGAASGGTGTASSNDATSGASCEIAPASSGAGRSKRERRQDKKMKQKARAIKLRLGAQAPGWIEPENSLNDSHPQLERLVESLFASISEAESMGKRWEAVQLEPTLNELARLLAASSAVDRQPLSEKQLRRQALVWSRLRSCDGIGALVSLCDPRHAAFSEECAHVALQALSSALHAPVNRDYLLATDNVATVVDSLGWAIGLWLEREEPAQLAGGASRQASSVSHDHVPSLLAVLKVLQQVLRHQPKSELVELQEGAVRYIVATGAMLRLAALFNVMRLDVRPPPGYHHSSAGEISAGGRQARRRGGGHNSQNGGGNKERLEGSLLQQMEREGPGRHLAHRAMLFLEAFSAFPLVQAASSPAVGDKAALVTTVAGVYRGTGLMGIISLCTSLLMADSAGGQYTVSGSLLALSWVAFRVLNNLARLDLDLLQGSLASDVLQPEFHLLCDTLVGHISSKLTALLDISKEARDPTMELCVEVFTELLVLLGFFALCHEHNQERLRWGAADGENPTLLQKLGRLPFRYFSDAQSRSVLFPALIAMCFRNPRNRAVLKSDVNMAMLVAFIRDMQKERGAVEGGGGGAAPSWLRFSHRFPAGLWEEAAGFFSST